MADQLVDELGLNAASLDKEMQKIRASIQLVLDKAKELNSISIKFGDYTAGIAEFKNVTGQAVAVQQSLTKSVSELTTTLANHIKVKNVDTKSTKDQTAAEAELLKKIKDENAARAASLKTEGDKLRVDKEQNKVLQDSNTKNRSLNITLKEQILEYNALVAAQGKNSAAAKAALANIDATKAKIQSLNEEVKKTSSVSTSISRVGSGVGSLLGAFGISAGIYQAVGFLKDSVAEFNEAEQAASRLQNTLKNIGDPAAFDRLSKKADDFAKTFKTIDNDEIIAVFQTLIQYGKLTEQQINELTPVIVNFAAQQRISLDESASVIIKALEGNGKALKTYGINIKDATNTTEAFGIVMDELAPKVEGAADAFGKTTAGQIKATEVEINNLKESIGRDLQPAIRDFYSVISEAIQGIPQLFSGMSENVKNNINDIKFNFNLLKEFFKGGAGGAAAYYAEVAAEGQKVIDKQKQLAVEQRATAFSNGYANQTLKEQTIAYQQQLPIWEASKRKVLELAAANKLNTEEGKKALLQLHEDKTVLIELNKLIAESVRQKYDTGTLGGGDPNAKFGAGGAGKTLKDQAYEDNKLILQDTIDTNKAIAADQYNLEQFRKNAAQDAYDETIKLIDLQLKHQEISLAQATINIRKAGEEQIKALQKIAADTFKLQQETAIAPPKTNEQIYKEQLDAHNKFVDTFVKQSRTAGDSIATDIAVAQLDAEAELNDRYDRGLVNERQYQKELADIKKKYALEALDAVIAEAKAEQMGYDPLSAEYIKLTKAIKEAIAAKRELGKADDSTGLEKLAEDLKNAQQVVGNLTQALSDLVSIGYNNQKVALEEVAAQQDKNYEQEIKNVEDSKLAEETKADRITVLNAKHLADQQANARKQQDLDNQKAKFDKEVAIFNIILDTAAAVVEALPNIPLAIAIGIAGAAQLAVALATKTPQLYKGTKSAAEGIYLTDERGAELYTEPDGRMYLGNNEPTFRYLRAGTEVTPADQVDKVLYNAMLKNTIFKINSQDNKKDDSIERLAKMIVKGFAKNRPVVHNHNNVGKDINYQMWLNKNVRGRG